MRTQGLKKINQLMGVNVHNSDSLREQSDPKHECDFCGEFLPESDLERSESKWICRDCEDYHTPKLTR